MHSTDKHLNSQCGLTTLCVLCGGLPISSFNHTSLAIHVYIVWYFHQLGGLTRTIKITLMMMRRTSPSSNRATSRITARDHRGMESNGSVSASGQPEQTDMVHTHDGFST